MTTRIKPDDPSAEPGSVTLHGVFLDVLDTGVLVRGEHNMGKSEMALELVSRGHRLVADDAPEFHVTNTGRVEGKAPPILQDFLAVAGLGVLNIRALYGDQAVRERQRLRLIVDLLPTGTPASDPLDRLRGQRSIGEVAGVSVDAWTMPVAAGRNPAVLIEAAVRHLHLSDGGYDAAEDLIERQRRARDETNPCA